MTIPPQPHLTTPTTGRSFVARFGLLCLASTLGFTPCRAQSLDALRSLLSADARSQSFGSKVQGLAGFGAVPGISGAHFNYSVDELLYGAALELNYKHALAGDIDVQGKLRYNQLFAETLDASDPALEGNGNFGVLTAFVQFDGPTPAKLFGRDLRWIGFAANSTFVGDEVDPKSRPRSGQN
jgi:hypothetical protein